MTLATAVVTLNSQKSGINPERPDRQITVTWDGNDEESVLIDKRGFGLVSFITGTAHTTAVTIKVQVAAEDGDTPINHNDPDGDLLTIPVTANKHLSTDQLAEIPFFRLVQDAAGVGVTKVVMS